LESLAANETKSFRLNQKINKRNEDVISFKSLSTVSRREIKERANLDSNLFTDPDDMVSIFSGIESEPDEFFAIEKL